MMKKWTAKLTMLCYHYDSVEDMRAHEEYMLSIGAKIFEDDEEMLYADFEIDNIIETSEQVS